MEDDDNEEFFDSWEEPTFRSQEKIMDIPKMVKLGSGEIIVGTIINETFEFMELRWPVIMNIVPAKVNNQMVPMIMLHRYAPGVWQEVITLNKEQCIFWNDTDSDLDNFYMSTIKNIYTSAEEYYKLQELPAPDPKEIEDDPEVERVVTQITIAHPQKNITDLIKFFTEPPKSEGDGSAPESPKPPLEPA